MWRLICSHIHNHLFPECSRASRHRLEITKPGCWHARGRAMPFSITSAQMWCPEPRAHGSVALSISRFVPKHTTAPTPSPGLNRLPQERVEPLKAVLSKSDVFPRRPSTQQEETEVRPVFLESHLHHRKEKSRAGKMAQQGKVLAAKPDSMGSTPRIHKVEGENPLLLVVLWPPHARCSMHTHAKTHAIKKISTGMRPQEPWVTADTCTDFQFCLFPFYYFWHFIYL